MTDTNKQLQSSVHLIEKHLGQQLFTGANFSTYLLNCVNSLGFLSVADLLNPNVIMHKGGYFFEWVNIEFIEELLSEGNDISKVELFLNEVHIWDTLQEGTTNMSEELGELCLDQLVFFWEICLPLKIRSNVKIRRYSNGETYGPTASFHIIR